MFKTYLKLMRVHHYIKNTLVFAALACSGYIFIRKKFISGMIGFITFCMVSSAVYIINDIHDKEKDKLHPTKCQRPIASGQVLIKQARILITGLLAVAVVCNMMVFHISSSLLLVLYLAINLAYSYRLRDIPLVDVSILALGFLIRVMYGAIITEIVVSNWLYLTVIAMSFYFALGKRRNELRWGDCPKTNDTMTR